jgi:hypothetical protein
MLRFIPRAVGAVFLLSLLGACGGGGDDAPAPPAATPTVALSLGAAAGSVAAGSSTTVTATITRGGGFTGPVTIAATGAPAGVTLTGGTIAAGDTTQVITIATTTVATTGAATLSITGTATGVTITPATYALTVTAAPPPPGVTMLLSAPTATGATTTVTANITRTNGFTGAVTVAATGAPTGVTITGGTIAAGATSQVLTIAASSVATPGTANVSITGTATGVTIAPDTLALTVTAPAAGQIGDYIGGEDGGDQAAAVALSANGSRVVIGALLNDGTGPSAGHARVYERNGNVWTKLGADLDGEVAEDRFGGAVAINDAGSRVIVGSYLNDGGGTNSGSARAFDWSGTAWVQVGGDIDGTVLTQSGRGSGWAVDMSASGHRVVTGGPGVGSETGEVAVYELIAGAWNLVGARITGSYELGHAVAMSDNGNRIALSQPSGSSNGPGTVTVYDWNGTAWVATGAPIVGEAADDFAGAALSLSGDGSVLAIGATSNVGGGLSGGGVAGGQVRVYRLAAGVWTQLGADLDGAAGSAFGTSVSLSADGTRLMAGGPSPSTLRLYTLAGTTWTLATTPVFTADRRAGSSVSISANGLVGAVGAEYGDTPAGNAAGIVRVYNLPAP